MAASGASQSSKGFGSGGKVIDKSVAGGIRPPATPGAARPPASAPPVVQGNSFAHKPGNVVSDDKFQLNLAFQPNILDNFDVYTYHWKLFIVDPESAATGKILETKNQTIIAESGVTDLTIDKVDIRGITTPSIETGTGVATNVKFEITEPSGAGLIDKIFYQAIGLGIGNWSVMPVYLQLQFRGRDPTTSESLIDGAAGSIATLKWVWPLKLTTIKANVTTVGTRYDFEAIIYNELAQSNAYFTMMSSVVLSNLKNVTDALNELQDKLNADQMLKLIDNYSIPDIFKIVVDPAIAGEELFAFNSNEDSSRSGSMTALDKKDATFGPGTSVDKIIDTILAHTPKFQKSMVGSDTPGAEGKPSTSDPSQMKKMWRIITESRPLQFDPRRLDDAREFTIFVIEYDVGVLESNVFQEANGKDSIAAERKRLISYLDKSILKKKYNYIFTGLNDQIINFDLTVNNAFAVSQSRMGGIYSNLAMSSKGIITQDNAAAEAAITERLSAAISFNNTAQPGIHNVKSIKDSQASITSAINASSLSEDTKNRYITLLEQSKPENRTNFLNQSAYGGINNDGKLGVARAKATNLAKPQSEQITNQQLNFISDVNTNLKDPKNAATVGAYNAYLEGVKGKLRPIAHIEQLQDKQIGQSIESSSNSGIQKLSSMFSVAMHSSLDSSFQSIKLTIKGDPFWLFPQPFSGDNRPIYNTLKDPVIAIDWIKNAHFRAAGEYANYYGTDNFLIIRFRTPRIYTSEETSAETTMFNEVATFSGVYKVTRVSSSFASGKFTQELECILDPFINIVNFSAEIEGNAEKKDVATSEAEPRTYSDIPPTAVKTQKLATLPTTNGKGVVSEGANANDLSTRLANDAKLAKTVTMNDLLGKK
jgi:hypothetical protein